MNETLLDELLQEYEAYAPRSGALQVRARHHLVDGGSHAIRLTPPFPPRIKDARGACVYDEDDHKIVDFWQGHFANILGHSPQVVNAVLADAFNRGFGLQTGFTDLLQIEVAEKLCAQTGTQAVRFTTSGTLATQYAIMLARGYTHKELVMKVGGGWHGGHVWGLSGVKFVPGAGYKQPEARSARAALNYATLQTDFNDLDQLQKHFRKYGNRLACFILEPVVGSGGFIPATRAYLAAARELTQYYGVVLIFDEVITGFRFRAGDVGELYGVKPDLMTLGKIIGGGMPVAAVAGKREILDLAGSGHPSRAWFSGGTYSGHPASMLAARAMIDYLVTHEKQVYPYIAALGQTARAAISEAFISEGIYAVCTGNSPDLPDSSLFNLVFPFLPETIINGPQHVNDPQVCDLSLKALLHPGLLLQDVYILDGKGSITLAHAEAHVKICADACRQLARRIKQSVKVKNRQ
ncbi:MAG: aminotransferase class III-fold pyridoxal phosphate-dependent enzyme [Anaerolineae bacterium]|nr:aminotransferase class III-fold pyridoxal phosphate-dependent enzyme [Anaerolineae bacterium]